MNKLKLLFLAIALSLSSAAATIDDNVDLVYAWGDQYVWSVQRYSYTGEKSYGYQSHGSGVWVNDTTMITACHVPTPYENEMWASANGHFEINVDMVVEFCHEYKDQAVMSVVAGKQHEIEPVVFGELPKRGERVYVVGYPSEFPLTVTSGWMIGKSVRRTSGDDAAWLLAAQAFGGNSGGAVVVVRNGVVELVGILTNGLSSGDLTIMRDLEHSKAWLAYH